MQGAGEAGLCRERRCCAALTTQVPQAPQGAPELGCPFCGPWTLVLISYCARATTGGMTLGKAVFYRRGDPQSGLLAGGHSGSGG